MAQRLVIGPGIAGKGRLKRMRQADLIDVTRRNVVLCAGDDPDISLAGDLGTEENLGKGGCGGNGGDFRGMMPCACSVQKNMRPVVESKAEASVEADPSDGGPVGVSAVGGGFAPGGEFPFELRPIR